MLLDLYSRKVVGYALSDRIDTELTLGALRRALVSRRPKAALLHHTDRGSQYASDAYRAELAAHGLVASMSRKGDCYDNAVAESFFSTLEFELGADAEWQTRDQAAAAVREYIDGFYNPVRRHSTIGGQSPIAFERRHAVAQEERRRGGSAPEPPQRMEGCKKEGSGKKAA